MGMGLLGFSPDEWRGVLGSSVGQLPPEGPTAPLFVPPPQAAPSPPADPSDGIMAALAAKLAAAHARAMLPEAADHGLSERQKMSPWQRALSPITGAPETYFRMRQEALDQMSLGEHQANQPETDQYEVPATGSEFDTVAPHPLSNVAKGVGNIALGGFNEVLSPISAAYRSLIGQPVEDVTGIPREYTELAAQLATPGIGWLRFARPGFVLPRQMTNVPYGVLSAESKASHELPATAPFSPAGPSGPLETISAESRAANELPITPAQPISPVGEAIGTPQKGEGVLSDGRIGTSELTGPMPELAKRYPIAGKFTSVFDRILGKLYDAKRPTDEEMQLLTARRPIQKEIDQGNIQPVFDQNARIPATPNEPSPFDTRNIRMKRATTQQKYEDAARDPTALERILAAYRRGLLQKENAAHWSDIGQVQKLFIKEFGPEQGLKEFKEFAGSIAATTAGADPEANFLMAHFARFLKAKGLPLPEYAYDVPYPAGGRYVIPNFAKLKKLIWDGTGITPANPKVFNFFNDLLGHYSSPARRGLEGPSFDGPMIDERISRLFHPDMRSPPRGSYGHFQAALVDLAKQEGVDTQLFRDLVWAGASPDHPTKSLIQIINESIERTHRITGMARDEIVRRGLLKAEIPLYGIGGGMLVAPRLFGDDDDNPYSPSGEAS